ncbi:MAG: hypothetical protein QXJ75_05435 [Candidatus Bathyarchaeia archaeon]
MRVGRRRKRKVVKPVKRRLPNVFVCPKCGGQSIKVTMHKDTYTADITCSLCGIKNQIPVTPGSQEVDIYCKFTDMFYQKPT